MTPSGGGQGHNSNALRDQVRNYVAEIERIESEIAELNSDKSEIYKSAKDATVDVKALRDVIAYRRKRAKHGVSKLEAEDEKFTEYLGLVEGGTSVATRVHARDRLAALVEGITDENRHPEFPYQSLTIEDYEHDPATGEVNEDRPAASGDSAEASASEGYSAATEAPLDSRSRTGRRNGGVGSVEPVPAERSPNPGQEITPAPSRIVTADIRRAARNKSDDLVDERGHLKIDVPDALRRTA